MVVLPTFFSKSGKKERIKRWSKLGLTKKVVTVKTIKD